MGWSLCRRRRLLPPSSRCSLVLCVVAGGSSLPEASRRCIANWEGGGSADDTKIYNDHNKEDL
jgi:hypothetical protein